MIGLYRGKSFLSRVIQWRTWSPYAHAAWITPAREVIEAWHVGGVRHNLTPDQDHTPGTPIDIFAVDLTEGEREGLMEFLLAQVGKRYDYRGVLKFISRRDGRRGSQERWFCSELIFAACLEIRRPLLSRIPSRKVHPGLLAYSPLLKSMGTYTTTQPIKPRRAENE